MNQKNASPSSRPDALQSTPGLDEILEEVRLLRASFATYRQLVEQLIEQQQAA